MVVHWTLTLRRHAVRFEVPTARQLAMYVKDLAAPVCVQAPTAACHAIDLEQVLQLVRRTTGRTTDADAPLMEAGLDSLSAVELRNQLEGAVGDDLALPSSLVFEAPTARELAKYFTGVSTEPAPDALTRTDATTDAVMVTATSNLLPGGVASAKKYGTMSVLGADMTSEVPAARWDARAVDVEAVVAGLGDTTRLRMRHGVMLCGTALIPDLDCLMAHRRSNCLLVLVCALVVLSVCMSEARCIRGVHCISDDKDVTWVSLAMIHCTTYSASPYTTA